MITLGEDEQRRELLTRVATAVAQHRDRELERQWPQIAARFRLIFERLAQDARDYVKVTRELLQAVSQLYGEPTPQRLRLARHSARRWRSR